MARRPGRELEPLIPRDLLSGEPLVEVPADPPRGRARVPRRVVLGAVVVVVLGVGVAAAQGALDRRAQQHAAATFELYQGADYELAQQTLTIAGEMVPDDQPRTDLVLAQAELAAAAADRRSLDSLRTEPWQDGGTRRLIGAVRGALAARIADLHSIAAWRGEAAAIRGQQPANPSDASMNAIARALVLVAVHSVHVSPPMRPPTDQVLADQSHRLAQWSDVPTGSTLAVANASGIALVNVDTSTAVDLGLTGTVQSIVLRHGTVVAITPAGDVLAKPPDAAAPSIMLGEAAEMLPARQPDGVWLVAGGSPTTVTEVDGSAHRLVDPVLVPRGATVTAGVTNEGLVLSTPTGLRVWDPASGRQRAVAPAPSIVLAASGDLVAWLGPDPRAVHVTDLGTGADRVVSFGAENMTAVALDPSSSVCAFSPDRLRLACPIAPAVGSGPARVAVVTLGDGAVAVPGGAVGDSSAHPITWSPDGSRLWWVVSTPQGSLLATWGVGEPSATELRYRAGNWLVGVAVIQQT